MGAYYIQGLFYDPADGSLKDTTLDRQVPWAMTPIQIAAIEAFTGDPPVLVTTARSLNIPEDGLSDCTALLNSALALGRRIWLTPGITYRVTSSLLFSADGGGLVSDGTATIYAPAASFNNTSLSNRYASNSCVVNMSGQVSSPYTARQNVTLRGVIVESEVSDGRMVDAVVGRNIVNLQLDFEAFGFPVGCGFRGASIRGNSRIVAYVHDFTTSAVWGTQPQCTGIEIDNDIVNSTPSVGIHIDRPKIEDLTFTGAALATWTSQTDGINLNGTGSYGHRISSPRIRNVGEGIDCFASHCTLVDVILEQIHVWGLKFIHGASFNTATGVSITDVGAGGIVFAGSTSPGVGDTEGNVVTGVTIENVNYNNLWTNNGGVFCTDNGGTTGKPRNNSVANVHITEGALGKYGWFDESTGSGNNGDNIRVITGAAHVADVSIANGGGVVSLTVDGGTRAPYSAASYSATGATPPTPPSGVTPRLHLVGGDGTNTAAQVIDAFAITPHVTMRRADGTLAAKSALASGAAFASLLGVGYGTSQYSGNAAAITFNASEAWTNSANGSEIRFGTTPIGSTTRATVMTLANAAMSYVGSVAGGNVVSRFANIGGGNATVILSLDPSTNGFNVRDSQIRVNNPGTNVTDFGIWTANGGAPTQKLLIAGDGTLTYDGLANFNNRITTARTSQTAASTTNFDCSAGHLINLDLAASITTQTFSNVPASGRAYTLRLFITQSGAKTIAWAAAVKWPAGVAPTLTVTAAKVDIVELTTHDGGTNWFGAVIGQNY